MKVKWSGQFDELLELEKYRRWYSEQEEFVQAQMIRPAELGLVHYKARWWLNWAEKHGAEAGWIELKLMDDNNGVWFNFSLSFPCGSIIVTSTSRKLNEEIRYNWRCNDNGNWTSTASTTSYPEEMYEELGGSEIFKKAFNLEV